MALSPSFLESRGREGCISVTVQMFLSQQVERNVIITNVNGKYELTDKLSKDVRLRKSQKFMESSVRSSSQNGNIVNTNK